MCNEVSTKILFLFAQYRARLRIVARIIRCIFALFLVVGSYIRLTSAPEHFVMAQMQAHCFDPLLWFMDDLLSKFYEKLASLISSLQLQKYKKLNCFAISIFFFFEIEFKTQKCENLTLFFVFSVWAKVFHHVRRQIRLAFELNG